MILASMGLRWRWRENVGRTQSRRAMEGPINTSCCSCRFYYAGIPPLLFLPWIWKWKVLGCIDIEGPCLEEIWIYLGPVSCLLVHSCSPCNFSLECCMPSIMVKPGMQFFFFLIPCQSAVPSDSRVGGLPSSYFQKVLLKITWGWRGRLLF